MLKFNDKLLKCLTKESGKKNITKLLDILRENGYVVTPPIKKIDMVAVRHFLKSVSLLVRLIFFAFYRVF